MNDFAELFSFWLACVIFVIFGPIFYVFSLCYEAYLWAVGGFKRWVV